MATERRPFDVTRLSKSGSTRLRRARTLSGRGASPAGAGAVHAPEFEQYGFIPSLVHPPRSTAQRCARYPEPIYPHIPILAPRYPRGFSLSFNVSGVIGIAANASGCAWARIRKGCFGRLEPGRGSGHPSWPRSRINAGQACKGGYVSYPCCVGYALPKAKDSTRPVCIRDAGCLVIVLSQVILSCSLRLSNSSSFFLPPPLNGYLALLLSFFSAYCRLAASPHLATYVCM